MPWLMPFADANCRMTNLLGPIKKTAIYMSISSVHRTALAFLCWFALPAAAEPVPGLGAEDGDLTVQRSAFLAAEQALGSGDRLSFERLAEQVHRYPLWPYLRAADLARRLDGASDDAVMAFIDQYQGSAPAEQLRLEWLKRLARQGRWQAYIDAYKDNGSETRECLYRRALLATGRAAKAFDGLETLYLTGTSLPAACDPLLDAWSSAGGLTPDLVWRRIDLTLGRGRPKLAKAQRRFLPAAERPWLDQLLALSAHPEQVATADLPDDPPRRAASIAYGIERLAKRDPRQAVEVWHRLEPRESLPQATLDRIHTAIGTAFAARGDTTGLIYLRRIQPRADNLEPQRQRLRAALRLQAWSDLAAWAEMLPAGADSDGEWRYWRARALAKNGDRAGAAHAFAEAATARSLWGFRAAELLGRAPALADRPVPVDAELLRELRASATGARIRELRRLGRAADVAREWRELTRDLGPQQLATAAAFAGELGLLSESIVTLARADYWDDLELRFPLAHRDLVATAAVQRSLPADWLYAVIRQESAFDADVASHAGAVGLMQLMPATAAETARDAGLPVPSRLGLIDPGRNIDLGSRYLETMRRRFDGHPLLATAAYNAGPAAVRRWLPEQPVAADLWLAEIPYSETRDYVRRVLTYRVIYAHRLGLDRFRLGGLLRPVGRPAATLEGASTAVPATPQRTKADAPRTASEGQTATLGRVD